MKKIQNQRKTKKLRYFLFLLSKQYYTDRFYFLLPRFSLI